MRGSAGNRNDKMMLLLLGELMLVIGLGGPALALFLSSGTAVHHPRFHAGGRLLQQSVPKPPRSRVDTAKPGVQGRVISVSSDKELQAALDQASPGDELALKAGQTFYGNFVLPRKNADRQPEGTWITITSSAGLPASTPAGTRLTPAAAGALAKLASTNAEPTLRAAPGSGYYRLMGIEVTIATSVKTNYGLVRLGEGTEISTDQLPHDIVIDRCYIHGLAGSNVRRGIALNCAASAVVDSWISDCHEVGADSQAICCWNGPGPFEISNNYLEAAGENVMFGGADPAIQGLIPSDIRFIGNYCRKPLEWRAQQSAARWSVKNLFELKNAERVLVEGNVFDNNWVDAQTGYAILFKSVNQDGRAPWSTTRSVTFRRNLVRHTSSGINIEGRDPHNSSGRTALVLIQNNLFEDLDANRWGGEGVFIKITDTEDVTVDHNTAFGTGSIIIAYGEPNERFVFTQNVVRNNEYGVKGDGTASGTPTLKKFFRGYLVSGNAILGGNSSPYPPGNCFPPCPVSPGRPSGIKTTVECSGQQGGMAGCEPDLMTLADAVSATGSEAR